MLAAAAERDDAPQIFTGEYYQRLHDLEERHWWSIGMRAIAAGLLLTHLHNAGRVRILDAGCGTGGTLIWLSRLAPSATVVGIDYSPFALTHCRRRGGGLALASVTDLPFSDNAFDVVICADVIQHLPQNGSDGVALREFHRVLRPGGGLFLRTNVRPGRREGTAAVAAVDPNYHQYSSHEVAGGLAAAGFTVEKLSYANMLPALAATWARRLGSRGAAEPGPGTNPGLRMRVPPRWLNTALLAVMVGEAWYLAKCHGRLPYGHSLVCLAAKPDPAVPAAPPRGRFRAIAKRNSNGGPIDGHR